MEILLDPKANAEISDFIAKKIRARVKNPEVAEMLIPKDHGFGTKRVPMETRYYEVYNQDNVKLVDLNTTPIDRITANGIQVGETEYALDYIIYATGFDAVTGAFKRIDIQGRSATKLADKWKDGPETYLGLQVASFPNMFMLVGPHNGATFCNIPRCIEQNVEWVSDCIAHMQKNDLQCIETTEEAEAAWTEHVYETTKGLLFSGVRSWFLGSNTPGKKPNFLVYAGGSPAYRAKCEEVVARGYEGFELR